MPGFRWLWSGSLVSVIGTYMQFVALPFFVHEETGSSFATAVSAAAQALPVITLGPAAGAVADSRDSRRLLIGANAVLAAVTLAFCLTLIAPWWVVAVVGFLQSVVAQLVAPAEVVLVPSLVALDTLPAANSLLGAGNSLARLVGPAAGGVLYAAAGLPAVALANAVSFVAAAVLISRISPRDSPLGTRGRATPPKTRLRRSRADTGRTAGAGWAEIGGQPLLRRLLAVYVLTGIGEGCVSALLAPYTAEVYGGSTALGLLLTCQAVGGLTGALVMSRWARTDRVPQTLGAAAIACGSLLAVLTGYPLVYRRLWPALLLIAVAGVPFAAVAATSATLLQTLPHPAVRGRVYGVTMAAAGAAHLVGILAAGYLADRTSVYVLLADAPCYVVAGIVMRRAARGNPQPGGRGGPGGR